MPSIQPISSAAASALIFELESNIDFLGPNPLDEQEAPTSNQPALAGKRLAKALARLRTRTLPKVLSSLNSSQIQVVRRTETSDSDDPLAINYVVSTEYVYAAVLGPSAEALETQFLTLQDFEVIIAAQALSVPLDESDAIRLDGVEYDIVGIRGYPRVPDAVAFRYWLKKAS